MPPLWGLDWYQFVMRMLHLDLTSMIHFALTCMSIYRWRQHDGSLPPLTQSVTLTFVARLAKLQVSPLRRKKRASGRDDNFVGGCPPLTQSAMQMFVARLANCRSLRYGAKSAPPVEMTICRRVTLILDAERDANICGSLCVPTFPKRAKDDLCRSRCQAQRYGV